jgi:hypothetical protein
MTAYAYLIFSGLCGAAAVFDALRRPHGQWVAADRNRGWWVTTIVTCGVFGLGPIVGAIYLLAIVPGFSRSHSYDASEFRK